MDGYERLMVGCVIFIPVIAVLLLASWKMWHGKWLGFSDFSYNAYEGPANPLQKRRGRRTALVCLVWSVAAVGVLGIAACSAVGGFPANLELVSGVLVTLVLVGGGWPYAASRRESGAAASDAVGASLALAEEYDLDTHRVAVLVIVMFAVIAVEIASSLIV